MSHLLEIELLRRVKSGDTAAFGELYHTYVAKIYRFILFKVQTHEEAEDLSADVFLRAWQHLYQQQRAVRNFRAFLYQIAKNLVIDYYRQRAQREFPADVAAGQAVDQRQQQLFHQAERSLELAEIAGIVRQLKDEYKDVVLLRYVEQLSVREIAQIIGKSPGAVRVILFRALKLIRHQLPDQSS